MKKIKLMAVFTVMALATSFAGKAQTPKATTPKTAAPKAQAVAPAKQNTSTTTSTTTAAKPTATHKAHKKSVAGSAKPAPSVKPKATVAPASHFARSHSNSNVMKGKHKKVHKKGGKSSTSK